MEEMQAMSRKEHRELLRRMGILIAYLLKWAFQPTCQGNSWREPLLTNAKKSLIYWKIRPAYAIILTTLNGSTKYGNVAHNKRKMKQASKLCHHNPFERLTKF
jgi:hypothetical protein